LLRRIDDEASSDGIKAIEALMKDSGTLPLNVKSSSKAKSGSDPSQLMYARKGKAEG
jgi:hypothetical protein